MDTNQAFGLALRELRNSKDLAQEDFSGVSSRTYISTLERGLKSPTLEKLDQLASVLEIHPLTLMVKCYLNQNPNVPLSSLWARVSSEL